MILTVPLLLCMDLQQEFVAPGRPFADPDGDEISAVCADLIAQARRAGWTVVHAQLHQGGPVIAGHGLTQPIPGCEPRPGEVLLRRAGVSAFAHPDMEGILESSMGAEAYMIGFSAPMSLTSTLYDAEDRRVRLSLVEGAIGGADVGEWAAGDTRALCCDTARRLSRAVTLEAVLSELAGGTPAAAAL
ncbi:MAG: isochorismatase family protein [Alphaproteobacteria bacterium]|nr:isochorismatase family protein [Alphaproteobacteria bacterium]